MARRAKLSITKLCFRKVECDEAEAEARINHAYAILFDATARIIAEHPEFGEEEIKSVDLSTCNDLKKSDNNK